jgi:hypothetical protein
MAKTGHTAAPPRQTSPRRLRSPTSRCRQSFEAKSRTVPAFRSAISIRATVTFPRVTPWSRILNSVVEKRSRDCPIARGIAASLSRQQLSVAGSCLVSKLEAGAKIGKLTIVSIGLADQSGRRLWECACDCGTRRTFGAKHLMAQSCGCQARENRAKHCRSRSTHGHFGTDEYSIWVDMRRRCSDPSRDSYKNYGAKGIRVCARWEISFLDFLADVGPRPSKQHTLDRRDSSGDYEPGNCAWADAITQANNKSNNRIVSYRGEQLTVANALRRAGSIVKKSTALKRLKKGWSVETAVETRA